MIGTMFAMVWGFLPFLILVADAAFPEKEIHIKTTGLSLYWLVDISYLVFIGLYNNWLEICLGMCLIKILVIFFARREGNDNHEEQLEQTFLSDLQWKVWVCSERYLDWISVLCNTVSCHLSTQGIKCQTKTAITFDPANVFLQV